MMKRLASVSRSNSPDRRVVQAFASDNLAAAVHHTLIEQVLTEETRLCQRHQQGLVRLRGDLARSLDRVIGPHHPLADTQPTIQRRQRPEKQRVEVDLVFATPASL